ncbi:MAG: N-acetylmuramoyl-L-alanine amidase [Verrucomicrobiales bacterium]|nr:N-acetylmuramoyl-L-alanine amidase [Verrucomicrobiales bacterium]
MWRHLAILPGITLLAGVLIGLPGCQTNQRSQNWEASLGVIPDSPLNPQKLHKELNIKVDMIAPNRYGRKGRRPMKPQYITIHSTQNYTGDAFDHARALKKGALRGGVIGYLCWHFTVQDDAVIQHIPTCERGEHADFNGPGNRYSIGIEMCEHEGNNILETIDRTAKLTASLMHHHDIPISNVVPHYHWPRRGYEPPNKNCPHFLLEDGRPKDTWQWFIGRVHRHYQRIQKYKRHAHTVFPGIRDKKQDDVVEIRRQRFRSGLNIG